MSKFFRTDRGLSQTETATQAPTGRDVVDWGFAASAAGRMVPAGPKVSRIEIKDAVAQLRASAAASIEPVAQTSLMTAPDDAAAPLIVDRPGWIRANSASMQAMMAPVLDEVMSRHLSSAENPGAKRGGQAHADPSELARRVGGVVSGAEVAGVLSWVSTKVLGQYDLAPQGTPRLLLVAPNIMAAERELSVDPTDFRLWVCMHEETHRVQFTSVPWLRGHIIEQAQSLSTSLIPHPDDVSGRMSQLITGLPSVLRGETDITTLLANEEQRARLADLTAVMALLEGHADVVMDEVGPSVIPTVADIRAKFTQRRKGAGTLDVLLRRLLGMEAKMRQYRDGAVFVRTVMEQVGTQGFNQVWSSPDALPRASEIADPASWVTRVHH
ncbi:MAG: zinc-dependent metalloprotease [Ornithinimicrobium sp.]